MDNILSIFIEIAILGLLGSAYYFYNKRKIIASYKLQRIFVIKDLKSTIKELSLANEATTDSLRGYLAKLSSDTSYSMTEAEVDQLTDLQQNSLIKEKLQYYKSTLIGL